MIQETLKKHITEFANTSEEFTSAQDLLSYCQEQNTVHLSTLAQLAEDGITQVQFNSDYAVFGQVTLSDCELALN